MNRKQKNVPPKLTLLLLAFFIPLWLHARNPKIDPIKFSINTTATNIGLNEEFEISITAKYASVNTNVTYVFQEVDAFKVKMVFPDGFLQTGGTYHDDVEVELSSSKMSVSYTVKGKFSAPSNTGSFLLLRSVKNTNNKNDFIRVGKIAFSAFSSDSTPTNNQTSRISLVVQKYIPFLSLAEFRAGKADTTSVIFIIQDDKSGTFILDKTDTTSPDDSAMILVSGTNRYKRNYNGVIDARWFGVNETNTNNNVQLQAAIDAANGKILRLVGGTFYCKNLTLNNHVNTVFEGAATLKLPKGTVMNENLLNITYSTNVTIKGLTLDGDTTVVDGTPRWGSILLKVLYSDNIKILNNTLQNCKYLAVDVIRSPNTIVDGNSMTNTDCGVIVWDDSDNSVISNNIIKDGTSDGIFIWGAKPADTIFYSNNITIIGNTINNKAIGWGISVRYGKGIAILGNTVTGCKWGIGGDTNGESIGQQSAKSLNISNNIISNCQHGLYFFCWDSVIKSNTLINISDSPIYISAKYLETENIPSKRVTVSGNRAYNSGKSTTDFITINRCEDCLVEDNIVANDSIKLASLVRVLSATSVRNVIKNNKASLMQPTTGVNLTTSSNNIVIGEQGELIGSGTNNVFRDGYSNSSDTAKLFSNTLTFPKRGDFFVVSGTGTMNSISTINQPYGKRITLLFPVGAVTINKLSGSGNINISNSSYTTPVNTTLTFVYNGTNWIEVGKKDIAPEFSQLNIDAPSATTGTFRYKVNSINAWSLVKNMANDFEVQRYDATGTYLDRPVSINRTTGIVGIPSISATIQNTRSSDGVTKTYNIPHGLPYTPVIISVQPITSDAFGFNSLTANGTNFQITYPTAPLVGTNNLQYNITYKNP
jgi:parallel beta-helix repeat protein